jgi:tRNA 2-selenouridine synthase
MTEPQPAETDDIARLFLGDIPLLDVRAPVEFAAGAFPLAENHPLMDDGERHDVGLTYKQHGQAQAVQLGHQLVDGDIKAARIAAWQDFMQRHPDGVMYCFRGGLRSRTSQRWLREETGISCPLVRGGYKAMRRFLLERTAHDAPLSRPVVVAGPTGCGKTRLLQECRHRMDLEALANHRGSAFGGHPTPQPSQIDFENAVAIGLMKHVADGNRWFAVEDESRNIGSRHVPPALYDRMAVSPVALIVASLEERIEITLQEYVHDALAEYRASAGEAAGTLRWQNFLGDSIDRIRRRLGGDRHAHARDLLARALRDHLLHDDADAHRGWIAYLLTEYYDGMYAYQLAAKQSRVMFRGTRDEVGAYLHDHYAI